MLKKVLRSKIFISLILLALTGVMVFGLLPMNYEKQNQVIEVIQLIQDIEAGTKITESMLTTRTIGLYGVDSDVIINKADIVGKYATMDLRRMSNLYGDMFASTWEEVEGAIDLLLDEDDRLITISLNSAAKSIGGNIKPGSIIDILITATESDVQYDEFGYPIKAEEGSMVLVPLMQNIMVYKVLNSALEDVTDLHRQWISLVENGDPAAENFKSSLIPAFVTLVVSEEQALILANQEYNGAFHFILKPLENVDELVGVITENTENAEMSDEYDPFEDIPTADDTTQDGTENDPTTDENTDEQGETDDGQTGNA